MRAARLRGESTIARLRQAVARKDLPAVGCGLSSFREGALTLRAATSIPTALQVSGASVAVATGIVDIEIRHRKNAQGQRGSLPISCLCPWGRRLSSALAVGMAVVKKVVRWLPRLRAPFIWRGSKRSAIRRIGPCSLRPCYARVVEKGAGERRWGAEKGAGKRRRQAVFDGRTVS